MLQMEDDEIEAEAAEEEGESSGPRLELTFYNDYF
jgi:hypothetical protein